MPKNLKLNLENLKIKSFVTSLGEKKQGEIRGGATASNCEECSYYSECDTCSPSMCGETCSCNITCWVFPTDDSCIQSGWPLYLCL